MKILLQALCLFFFPLIVYSQTFMKITQGTGSTLSTVSLVDSISFTPTFNCGDVVLFGGETYPTIQIGSQCWFQKNLNIGIMVTGNQTNNGIIEKYGYDDNLANCATYGGLYQWNEAMKYGTNGSQGICPTGWHIPTLDEFNTLKTTVNNIGRNLKALGQGSGAGVGTNSTGFSALSAGSSSGGIFYYMGDYTNFWSSSEYDNSSVYYMLMIDNGWEISLIRSGKTSGLCVRCLKD